MLPAKRSGILVAGVVALVLGWARPADAQTIKVGSFTKVTGGAPVTQVVPHGVGLAPKALILWTDGKTNEAFSADFLYALGMTDGTTSFSTAASSQNGVNPPTVWRQLANKALAIWSPAGVALAEADLQSWDATNFTLNWTTNDATPYVIHFIAIGGPAVSAKVVNWTMATAVGNTSVTGVGFKPDVVLHAHLGPGFTTAPPSGTGGAHSGLGAMDKNGGQWATDNESSNNGGIAKTLRGQQTNACIYALNLTGVVQKVASFVSMDADGFTVSFTTVANTNASQVVSLALKGVLAKAGSFNKSTTVGNQPVTGVGFSPGAVLLASFQDVTQALPVPHNRLGLGAADRTGAQGASAIADNDASNPTIVQGIDKTSKAFVKVNNNTSTIDAEANVSTFDPDGFTLNWTTNDAIATQILYLALGPVPTVNYRSIGTAANDITGTVSVTNGSSLVTGALTDWKTANRGRGDRIRISGVDYVAASVSSDTQLRLTTPYTGATASGLAYTIARQFTTLQDWENCISFGVACPFFPVASASLVADGRREVGIAYKDSPFTPLAGQTILTIQGSTTGPSNDITLTVDPGNRHNGIAGTGVVLDNGANTNHAIIIFDGFVTVEWLEVKGGAAGVAQGIRVDSPLPASNKVAVRYCLIHNTGRSGIRIGDPNTTIDLYNNEIYRIASSNGVDIIVALNSNTTARVFNNTVFGVTGGWGIGAAAASNPTITLRNNIAHSNGPSGDFNILGPNAASSNNLSSDATATTHSPGGGGINSVPLSGVGGVNFVNTGVGTEDLHLTTVAPLSRAQGAAADLSPFLQLDIDGEIRTTPWDIGADQASATTLVTLQSFSAQAMNSAVELKWQTGSELNNLGFNLYRSLSSAGPYQRITSSAIPGLGSSPVGASYSYLDSGLSNGTTYYYELEDIETTGKTTLHGPVSATPQPSATGGGSPGDGSGSGAGSGSATSSGSSSGSTSGSGSGSPARITYGNPSVVSLHVLEQDRHHVLLELLTPGFYATPNGDGSVRLEVPGFVSTAPPGSPALPTLRTWVEAVAGRGVRLDSIRPSDVVAFSSLRPVPAGLPEMGVGQDGTIRASFRSRKPGRAFRRPGLIPAERAQILETGFQGETKKAEIELAPLRWDPSSQRLLLARRMLVRVVFAGVEPDETSFGGSRGHKRRERPSFASSGVLAWLTAHEPGLYAVRFEDVFPSQRKSIPSSQLRLSYQGQPVGFHVEPNSSSFGPGSLLYFLSQGASLDPYGDAVYMLEHASGGVQMTTGSAVPSGSLTAYSFQHGAWEVNRLYQGGLLEASDLWMWDGFITSLAKTFTIDHLASSQEPARLSVFLQGASDFEANPDHHVRASLNGVAVGDVTWDGKTPMTLSADVSPGILLEGNNTLTLENVPDIQAAYSLVYLDRFTLDYPRQTLASSGRFEGRFSFGGQALVPSLDASTRLVDTTAEPARWLTGALSSSSGVSFRAEAGRSYLAVSDLALLHSQVRLPLSSSLKSTRNQADYVLIGPRDFLPAAQPLLDLRRGQGLHVMAVAVEDVYDSFGFGEPRPEAIKDFLAFAFHNWQAPALHYVLLLGDATYDPKNLMGTGVVNRVPPLMVKTSFMWTVSDPTLAAVNGNDALPDLAIGRLPAASLEEANVMVDKTVAFEKSGFSLLNGPDVLVADNPDQGGDFEKDAQDIATTFFAGKPLEEIFLSQQGGATRSAIMAAFNGGTSLVSYIGHGSTAVWASENVFNSWDVQTLLPQAQQPFLMTLDCLNGYFLPPQFNSLAEALVKADGKGAIASFSPSSLSLNDAAHLYHKALLSEILSGRHDRMGDAVLAAQATYATTGAFPEALAIYHLIGDPALRIR